MAIPIGENYIKWYLLIYLATSAMLSLVVALRLILFLKLWILNILFYDLYYHVFPAVAVLYIIWIRFKSEKLSDYPSSVWVVIAFISFWVFFSFDCCFNSPLSYTVFPITTVFLMFLYLNSRKTESVLLSKKVIALSLIMILSMPYVVTMFGFRSVLSVAEAASDADKVELVSDYVRFVTTSFWGLRGVERGYVSIHRASSDLLKFLIVGAGSCGEMAHATKAFLDNLNMESRLVSFPGEDHVFVEVKMQGDWLVVDPGYGLNLVTREERGLKRCKNIGGLSYVVAYTDQGLVELTQHYVTTDRIVVRILDNGEPTALAKVMFQHTFMGSRRSLPEFFTDSNGTVELSLGPLTYNNSKIEPAEPYYWIFVNGKNTKLKATSTGSGKLTFIELDVAEIK